MKKISEINELEIGKEYYLELHGTKIKAYITNIEEEYQRITLSFPCLLSGEGFFRDVNIDIEDEHEFDGLWNISKTVHRQMRGLLVKYLSSTDEFIVMSEAYYSNFEEEDEIIVIDRVFEPVCIYMPTRDTIYEKFQQISLNIVMDKYGFPELSTYTEGFL